MKNRKGIGGRKGYTLFDKYFQYIDTEEKAYFLGLLYADGCNIKNSNGVSLQLKEDDLYILEKFKDEIKYTGPIRKVIKKNIHYNLTFYSKEFSSIIEEKGIIPNKSKKLDKIPDIPNKLLHHFIRGYFDGDGCIRMVNFEKYGKSNKLRFCIAGNEPFLLNIQKEIINQAGLSKTKLCSLKNKTTKQIEYSGNINCQKIYSFLYKNSTIFFKRKKDIFETICQ